jgi:hypothetical protein
MESGHGFPLCREISPLSVCMDEIGVVEPHDRSPPRVETEFQMARDTNCGGVLRAEGEKFCGEEMKKFCDHGVHTLARLVGHLQGDQIFF